jgi:asparagine synthase (glutamine-hydrolysing)
MQYHTINSQLEHQVARECGATAFFNGVGGDQLFYQVSIADTVGDYLHDRLREKSLPRGLRRLAMDVARTQGMSVWPLLRGAVRDAVSPRWDAGENQRTTLIRPDVVQATRHDPYLQHPWLRDTSGVALGKLRHIRQLSVSHDFYDPLAPEGAPERVRPLVSQPLMALCARAPSYLLAAHGRDRFAVRYAFSRGTDRDLPSKTAWQYSKGLIDQFYQELLRNNAPFVRELLMDSLLAKEVLARDVLEEVLDGGPACMGAGPGELVAIYVGLAASMQQMAEHSHTPAASIALG